MAETEAASHAFNADFIKQKVGPLPLWMWMVAGFGIWWWFSHQASTAATPANTGIDPTTGEPYAQELGAANQQLADLQTGTADVASTGGYADDNAWGRAAVNYLVGLGVDPTQANEAIQQYLASQTLTTQQQGDVNLAIQGIGSPPDLPGPVGQPPGGVVTPPGGGGGGGAKPTKAPGGLKAVARYTQADLSWHAVTGADQYRIRVWSGSKIVHDQTVSGTKVTVGNLKKKTHYGWHVQAKNKAGAGPWSGNSSFSTK